MPGLFGRPRSAGVPLMVHENWRWQPAIVALREDITRGSIGKPFYAQVAGSFATSLRALLRPLLRAAVVDLPARKPIRFEPDVNPTPIFFVFQLLSHSGCGLVGIRFPFEPLSMCKNWGAEPHCRGSSVA